jgi:hypothetical protein
VVADVPGHSIAEFNSSSARTRRQRGGAISEHPLVVHERRRQHLERRDVRRQRGEVRALSRVLLEIQEELKDRVALGDAVELLFDAAVMLGSDAVKLTLDAAVMLENDAVELALNAAVNGLRRV